MRHGNVNRRLHSAPQPNVCRVTGGTISQNANSMLASRHFHFRRAATGGPSMSSLRILLFCLTACAALNAASREIVPVSAGWNFQIDVSDLGENEQWYENNFDRSAWAKVSVPKAWDLYDEALWGYEGIGWYAARIDGAQARKDSVQRLK